MASRKTFPDRVRRRREGALYRLEKLGNKNLPKDEEERKTKKAKREAEIAILRQRVGR